MLDAPEVEGEIRGWRGLVAHLFVITLGLLIALGLEGGVEWIHHRNLAREARETVKMEFAENQATVERARGEITALQKVAKQNLAAFDGVKAQAKDVNISFHVPLWMLKRSAWDTARETGAFEYMNYAEVDSYAQLVALQDEFMIHEDRLTHAYSHGDTLAFRLQGLPSSASKQDVNAVADQGIGIVLDLQSELVMCDWVGKRLEARYKEVLNGKR